MGGNNALKRGGREMTELETKKRRVSKHEELLTGLHQGERKMTPTIPHYAGRQKEKKEANQWKF